MTDSVAPDIAFRPVSAFPDLVPAPEKTSLRDIVAKDTKPTLIHMYDSC